MINEIGTYFLLFVVYSVAAWVMETGTVIITEKKFVNRGFLIGPYCPIYGFGVVLITILLRKYADDILALMVFSVFICGILEYSTSFFMEKIFNARWWDYSKNRFNINGRICLETLIPFAVAGCIIVKYINPFLINYFSTLPDDLMRIIIGTILMIFLVDSIISFRIIIGFKNIAREIKDNTEEISEKVRATAEEISDKVKCTTEELSEKVRVTTEEISSRIREKTTEISNKIRNTTEDFEKFKEEFNIKFREAINNKPALYRRLLSAFPDMQAQINKFRKKK